FKTTIKEKLADGWKVVYAGQEPGKEKGAGNRKGKNGNPKGGNEEPGAGSGAEREDEAEETETPFVLDPALPVACSDAEVKEKETQPPKAYTEGTLLKAMESAGKQLENEELRDAMKDAGLGTPATRAATIERLKNVGYITMQGKRSTVTQKGRTAIELIRHAGIELLTSPEMTGQWERRLYQISKGEAAREKFMENVKRFTLSIIDKVRVQPKADASLFEIKEEERKGGRGKGPKAKSSAQRKASGSEQSGGNELKRPDTAEKKRVSGSAPGSLQPLAPCPREGCGGQLIEGRKGYGCTHYKQGCGFVIWKEYAGKNISVNMLTSLAGKGQTQLLTFKQPEGDFKARIVLADSMSVKLDLQRAQE